MEQSTVCNAVNVLYYLYFEKRELVYHFERIWSDDGMRYKDDVYAYVFCGMSQPWFVVDLDTYYFLLENQIIEETSGNEHESIYTLSEYHTIYLDTTLRESKGKKRQESSLKTVAT